MDKAAVSEERGNITNRYWRLNHLYRIIDVKGNSVPFVMNVAQEHLYKNLHYYNVILKARQLGFTTLIMIYLLDSCLWNDNQSCGVIAHTRDDAEELFKNKIRFAYDNLPEWLKLQNPAKSETARKLEFSNGSSILVGTSLRSGTLQKLHISEYGKIAARYPDKALEIKTGALNTVHEDQQIFIESTAEGRSGEFFDVCETARKLKDTGKPLTYLDPKFHFFPWYENPGYVMKEEELNFISIAKETNEYLDRLGLDLTPVQRAWYAKKEEQQGDMMKREFPSTPKEAFEQSMEGAYYTKQMQLIRNKGQITHIPHEVSKPVYTFWDLNKGGQDYMTCLFFQHIGNKYRFIDYEEAYGEDWPYWSNLLASKGYAYAYHKWPHDGNQVVMTGRGVKKAKELAQEFGIRPIKIVTRSQNVHHDIITKCKTVLARCWFDEVNCAKLITHLDSYRKEYDEKLGQWKDKPRHDDASHGCDGFRTFACGYEGRDEELNTPDYDDPFYTRNEMADTEYDMYG